MRHAVSVLLLGLTVLLGTDTVRADKLVVVAGGGTGNDGVPALQAKLDQGIESLARIFAKLRLLRPATAIVRSLGPFRDELRPVVET